tara:strand:- start:926 stop:1393 length:468 start_codon:yes stop_codon:yes gene_type:complete
MEDKDKRIGRMRYFMEMASLSAQRGTCLRNKVGCVLVFDNRIKSVGYNSSHKGTLHCEEVGGPDNCIHNDHCIRTLHAEEAAVLNLEKRFEKDLSAYITHEPCLRCHKILAAAGVIQIYYLYDYGDFSDLEKEIKESLNCSSWKISDITDLYGDI